MSRDAHRSNPDSRAAPPQAGMARNGEAVPDELPYDQDKPPRDPPAGANPTLWRLGYLVYETHWRLNDGHCNCGEAWLCGPAQLAREQMRLACHIGQPGAAVEEHPARQPEPGA